MFTRAKARKSRLSISKSASRPDQTSAGKEDSRRLEVENVPHKNDDAVAPELPKKRRNKLSFSTPDVRGEKPVRRSKRLSDEAERTDGSPQHKVRRKDDAQMEDLKRQQEIKKPRESRKTPILSQAEINEDHSATKIALPFADTPIIRKNKAMRDGKGAKGERRSSLGLRGRRASSLIDSGNSNGEHLAGLL